MRPTDSDFREALDAHGSRIERYRAGTISNDEFRPIRLSYGLYYQLHHTSHLQRIKLPGGWVTREQAECLASLADDFGRGVLHITTRQDVQLHWVPLEAVMDMYRRLHEVGITTRGACADTVRNVTGCYHAGTLPDEPFDVTPYLFAVHEYFLFHPLNLTLPRKFKIAVASCAADCVQGPVNDIGLYPTVKDGELGFRVLAGGGLGSQPFLAVPVRDFVRAADLLVLVESIVRVHHRLGERKNRYRARLKYVVKNLGVDGFLQAVDAEYAAVERDLGGDLRRELAEMVGSFSTPPPAHPAARRAEADGDPEFAHWLRTNVREQRQAGYYGVDVQLPLGDCSSAEFRAIAALAGEHGNGTLRTSNDQNLYLPWIPGDRLPAVHAALSALRLAAPDALHISDVTSCPGADYCNLAVSRSMSVAAGIRKRLVAEGSLAEELGVFRIKISGCPNSCGQHHVGDIGLTGMAVKNAEGQETPHYSILVGGSVGADTRTVGRRVFGRYPEEAVPGVIVALARHFLGARRGHERFPDFVERVGLKAVSAVAQQALGVGAA